MRPLTITRDAFQPWKLHVGALEALSMPNSAITPQQCRSCAQPHSALLLQDILLTPVTGA